MSLNCGGNQHEELINRTTHVITSHPGLSHFVSGKANFSFLSFSFPNTHIYYNLALQKRKTHHAHRRRDRRQATALGLVHTEQPNDIRHIAVKADGLACAILTHFACRTAVIAHVAQQLVLVVLRTRDTEVQAKAPEEELEIGQWPGGDVGANDNESVFVW